MDVFFGFKTTTNGRLVVITFLIFDHADRNRKFLAGVIVSRPVVIENTFAPSGIFFQIFTKDYVQQFVTDTRLAPCPPVAGSHGGSGDELIVGNTPCAPHGWYADGVLFAPPLLPPGDDKRDHRSFRFIEQTVGAHCRRLSCGKSRMQIRLGGG